MLSQAEIGAFVADGFVAVRGAVPADVLRACLDEIWSALGERGVRREDPSTWRDPVVRIDCPETEAFAAAGTQPVLWEAFDQLIGEGRWRRRRGVGGTIPVRFPSQADPGDAGWHIEGSFDRGGRWWVNYRSRQRGLLALYLFSDVDADGAPTRVRPGSHRDAARALAPAGDGGMPFPQAALLAAQASADRPTALATGRAGDVILCHPFLVHAASWPHTGRHPRIMAQPGVALHDAFPLVPPLSPVELPMIADGGLSDASSSPRLEAAQASGTSSPQQHHRSHEPRLARKKWPMRKIWYPRVARIFRISRIFRVISRHRVSPGSDVTHHARVPVEPPPRRPSRPKRDTGSGSFPRRHAGRTHEIYTTSTHFTVTPLSPSPPGSSRSRMPILV